jgi:hypothetical protein
MCTTPDHSPTHQHDERNHHHDEHNHSILYELYCHLPYAIYSVAFSLMILSIFSVFTLGVTDSVLVKKSSKILFHCFHFMHIVFAATGTMVTFFRFSKNKLRGFIVGTLSPTFFCILSDAVLPYVGGTLLGVPMRFHACFFTEPHKVVPFLIAGIINGYVMSKHHTSKQGSYSLNSHATHIFISSLASTFYLISHGFTQWYASIGNVFILLIIAVVVPCTLADVVVPMTMARFGCNKK